MDLCSDGHTEICYDSSPCPMCDAEDERNKEVDVMQDEIDSLASEVNDLQSQLDEAE